MGARRPWKVIPGYSDGRGFITFEQQHNGIPVRSYATEDRARAAADDMVNRPDGYFSAVRLSGPDWPIGDVDAPDLPALDVASYRWTQWVDVGHLRPLASFVTVDQLVAMGQAEVMCPPAIWRDIEPGTGRSDVLPSDGQIVWVDTGVQYRIARYRHDLVGRDIAPGLPARPWCDQFGNSLRGVPLAWRPLDPPPTRARYTVDGPHLDPGPSESWKAKVLLSTGGPADYLTATIERTKYGWERTSDNDCSGTQRPAHGMPCPSDQRSASVHPDRGAAPP